MKLSATRASLFALVACSLFFLVSSTANLQASTAGWPRLLFIGDSLTEGYGVAKEDAFPTIAAQHLRTLGFPQLTYINAGSSGATSSFGPKLIAFQIKKNRPDFVIYALGSNDGLRGINPKATRGKIEAALDLLKSQGIPVLLTGQRAAPNYGPAYTKAFDGMFAEIAKARGIPFLPFLLKGVAADPALNLADGIHPNPAGYKVIGTRVAKALVPLLQGLKPPSTGQDKDKKKPEANPQ